MDMLSMAEAVLARMRLFFSILRAFVILVVDPKKTQEILRLAKAMHRAGLYDPVIQRMTSDPRVAQMFKEKYVRGLIDIESLSRLPAGTLGREFVNFVVRNNLDPNYFHEENRKIENDNDYYEVRLRETHDIWHVILGFDTDEPGEVGVQGFMIAQFAPPLSAFLIGGSFFRVLFNYPTRLFVYVESISRGFQLGVTCPPFMAEKWEEHWTEPLASVRAKFGVPKR